MASSAAPAGQRIRWLDGVKALAILWIAYFHCFEAYVNQRLPSPLDPDYFRRAIRQCAPPSTSALIECAVKATYAAIAGVGFHAVGVFVIMSGFGLTYSLAFMDVPSGGWSGWYRTRVLRLFPMYWAAHLLYLVSPFEARLEPIDYRFVLSFLGDRIAPIYYMFYYLNPAWWYFGLILELYLVFPFLFRLMRRAGAGTFLVICAAVTIVSRYMVIFVLNASGYYLLGAFFGCRLWEFGLGMVLGVRYRTNRTWVEANLFSVRGLVAGSLIYTAGLYSYGSALTYTLTDGLIGSGLFVILAQLAWQSRRLPRLESAIAYIGVYSYGFYLVHQPYVIYFGERTRGMPLLEFAIAAIPLVLSIALGSSLLERAVNAISNRVFEPRRIDATAVQVPSGIGSKL
jgi:peptidoglycan/LPS O-acetylase OafA/YrhL